MILQILMINTIICFIIDISGIIESIEWWLSKMLGGKVVIPKPFSCSLCMCFWMGLLWLAIQSNFTLFNVMIVCLMAALSEQITNMIIIIKNLIGKVQDWLITILQ